MSYARRLGDVPTVELSPELRLDIPDVRPSPDMARLETFGLTGPRERPSITPAALVALAFAAYYILRSRKR